MSRDRSDIEAIKERLDIVQLVQRYLRLRPVGERWSGVCPFHEETKPSLSVSSSLGAYYCFGCQASGDVIDFYRRINGLEFTEALRDLAEEAGVTLRASSSKEASSEERSRRRLCYEANSVAAAYFQNQLASSRGEEARRYLHQTRGFSQQMSRDFQLGYSPEEWEGLKRKLQQSGYKPEQGVEAGLLSQSRRGRIYDRFRGRILFPIHDLGGKVVAFGGRALGDGEPKYINSSESPVFKKGEHLYGLYQARKSVTQSKEAILTEGYSDVLTLVQYGFTNACGILGTALGPSQIKRLAGLCKRVTLVFDGDRAGVQAAQRSAEMILQQGISAYVVTLPQDVDVDEYLRQHGRDSFRDLLGQAGEGLAFCLSMIRSQYAPREMINWAVSFVSNLGDRSWQAYFLPRIAEGLNISETELRDAVSGNASRPTRARGERTPEPPSPGKLDREFLRFAVAHPDYLESLQEIGLQEVLRTDRGRQFWAKLLRYGPEGVEPHLDEGEKRFLIQSRFTVSSEEDPEALWSDLREKVERMKRQKRHRELQQALQLAQSRGDSQEVHRLLAKISHSTKGGE